MWMTAEDALEEQQQLFSFYWYTPLLVDAVTQEARHSGAVDTPRGVWKQRSDAMTYDNSKHHVSAWQSVIAVCQHFFWLVSGNYIWLSCLYTLQRIFLRAYYPNTAAVWLDIAELWHQISYHVLRVNQVKTIWIFFSIPVHVLVHLLFHSLMLYKWSTDHLSFLLVVLSVRSL